MVEVNEMFNTKHTVTKEGMKKGYWRIINKDNVTVRSGLVTKQSALFIAKQLDEKESDTPKNVEQVYAGYQDGEWANQFYAYRFKVDGKEVEVTTDLTRKSDWRVVWDGAVDYDGNKAGLLKRYPEFKKYLR